MTYVRKNGIININIARVANLLRKRFCNMKKKTARFHKLIGLISLTLGIHFSVAHFVHVLPFGLESTSKFIMFSWAYLGGIIGIAFIIFGISNIVNIDKIIDYIIDKIGIGR